jgi:hypothetical protein
MKITVQIVVDPQDGTPPAVHQAGVIERIDLTPATAGLHLDEAHQVLGALQQHLIAAQAQGVLTAGRACPGCGRAFRHKDTRTIVVRTLFGVARIPSPRLRSCPCVSGSKVTFSPIAAALPERTTPELLYWESTYAALTSYDAAAALLSQVFPLGRALQATAIRQRVQAVAQRLEDELGDEQAGFITTCPADWEELPRPDLPLVVGLDGGYVHSSQQTSRRDGWFEVVTGRSTPTRDGPSKCFAFVRTHDTKPKRRLFEVLRSQGMQDNQQITFLTDGGEDVRHLPEYLNPQATHLLDWFHITMRITVLRQSTRTLPRPPVSSPGTVSEPDSREPAFLPDPDQTDEALERVKHFLWHGNTYRALGLLTDLVDDHERVQDPQPRQRAFWAKLTEFHGYLQANQAQIPNYGERHRCGEAISSSTAESAVNQVISRRMVKKQQMRWTPAGAHLLLQIRTRVLNNDLADDFHRWYPGLAHPTKPVAHAA